LINYSIYHILIQIIKLIGLQEGMEWLVKTISDKKGAEKK